MIPKLHGPLMPDGVGLSEVTKVLVGPSLVHLRVSLSDGSYPRISCQQLTALGGWWTGKVSEATCWECVPERAPGPPYCGLSSETGRAVPPFPGKVGYCGVSERRTALIREEQLTPNGLEVVWVCQSDSSWMDREP